MNAISSASTGNAAPVKLHPQTWRAVISSSIGNALEWFDVLIYGAFAVIIAKLFFPTENETVSLLVTFATFGVSFFMRPLGAVVLGAYSDRVGRKAALSLSIVLMTIGTAMIAFMPTYASIGLWAPAGIVLARLIQGFSAGGEFGSSTAFLISSSSPRTVVSRDAASASSSALVGSRFARSRHPFGRSLSAGSIEATASISS